MALPVFQGRGEGPETDGQEGGAGRLSQNGRQAV